MKTKLFHFTCLSAAISAVTFGTQAGEICDVWDSKATYTEGDCASYENFNYQAKWWTRGEQPGSADVWLYLDNNPNPPVEPPTGSCKVWVSTKAYNAGDCVSYHGREYEAQWWTKGEVPVDAVVWKDKTDGPVEPPVEPPSGSCEAWDSSKAYSAGACVNYLGTDYEAKWWTQGEKPGSVAVWVKKSEGPGPVEPPVNPPVDECPQWEGDKIYTGGQCVTFKGATYEAKYWVDKGGLPDVSDAWKKTGTLPPKPPVTTPPKPDGGYIEWEYSIVFLTGDIVLYERQLYEALYWNKGSRPTETGEGAWRLIGNPPQDEPIFQTEPELVPQPLPLPSEPALADEHITHRVEHYSYDALGRITRFTDAYGYVTQYSYDALGNLVAAVEPDGNTHRYVFDDVGNLVKSILPDHYTITRTFQDKLPVTVKDPGGVITTYKRDGLGDITAIQSPDSGSIAFSYGPNGKLDVAHGADQTQYKYDEIGRTVSVTTGDLIHRFGFDITNNSQKKPDYFIDSTGRTDYQYDTNGFVSAKTQKTGSFKATVNYRWDKGALTDVIYPSGTHVTYAYTNGQVVSVYIDGQLLITNVRWTASGQPISWEWGNGQMWHAKRDASGRLSRLTGAVNEKVYRYDGRGNIKSIRDGAVEQLYRYDLQDRLISVDVNDIAYRYEYTPNGSRQLLQGPGGKIDYRLESGSNRLVGIASDVPVDFAYDQSGNMLNDHVNTYAYNAMGKLRKVMTSDGSTEYGYNALNQRVIKRGHHSGIFVYGEDYQLLSEFNLNGVLRNEYIWLGDLPVAVNHGIGADKTWRYVWSDHLGTPREISEPKDKVVIWHWRGEAFGSSLANSDPDGDGVSFTYNLRFPGQYYDAESGLHYNIHRYYSPALGQYITTDPLGLRGGLNLYQYAGQNPLMFSDPYGLFKWPGDIRDDAYGHENSSSGTNGPKNAFQHCFAACMMRVHNGTLSALILGDGLELMQTLDPNSTQSGEACEMDLHNNTVGMMLGNTIDDDGSDEQIYNQCANSCSAAGGSGLLSTLTPRG